MKCLFPYLSKTGRFFPCGQCYACKSSKDKDKRNEVSKTLQGQKW